MRRAPTGATFDLATIDVELIVRRRNVVRAAHGGHPTKDPLLPAVALVNDLRTGRASRRARS